MIAHITASHFQLSIPNIRKNKLELFDFHCIEWHWHREFEFLYVESGKVTCGIGEKQIILSEGEAIFINSKILHRFYAPSGGIIPNFVCMPEFIAPENSLIYKKYILPIISSNIYFQRFQTDELWQTKIIQTMIKIMEIQGNEKIRELATLALMQDLWLTFYENVKLSDKGDVQTVDEVAQKRVQLIMQYIHENYNHNLSLDEISSHIGISKSTALNLFHRFLHTTPVNYLIGYRLQAASWLLKNTNKKVKTIAYESGFHNVDYFCRLFKKRYHLTPSEYRCTCLKLLSARPINKADAGFLNPVSALLICEDFEKFILMIHQRFNIFFRCGDRCNTIIFYQIV